MSSKSSNTSLRILFINSIQMFGGGEIWMLTAMTELRNRGHQIGLICRPGTELENRCKKLDFPMFAIPMRGDFDPVTIYKFYKVFKRFNADVLLTNMDKELRLTGLAKLFIRDTVLIPRRGIDYPLKNHFIYRKSYKKWADGIIANSKSTKQSILKNAPWLNPEKIKVIYNGIDPNRFNLKSDSLRKKLGFSPDDFVFGFVGQLDERKGLRALLPAFAQVLKDKSNIYLLLVGEGMLKQEIEEFISQYKLEKYIHLLGFQENIPEFMANINTLVLPSLWEGFGIVLIEAMAAKKPVISTQTSNIPEIVEDGIVGKLVEPQNVDELANALLEFVSNPQKVEKMGIAGREMVEKKFTLDRMINELEQYFHEIINQKKCS